MGMTCADSVGDTEYCTISVTYRAQDSVVGADAERRGPVVSGSVFTLLKDKWEGDREEGSM